MRVEIGGLELHRLSILRDRFLGATEGRERKAEIVIGLGQIRLRPNRLPIAGDRLFVPVQGRIGDTEIVAHRAGARTDRKRSFEFAYRLLVAVERLQRGAEVVMGVDEVRLGNRRPAILLHRLIEAPERGERDAKIIGDGGGVRVELHRAAEQRLRLPWAALLVAQHAEIVQRVHVIGISLQHGTINPRRLVEPALAVRRNRRLICLRGREPLTRRMRCLMIDRAHAACKRLQLNADW